VSPSPDEVVGVEAAVATEAVPAAPSAPALPSPPAPPTVAAGTHVDVLWLPDEEEYEVDVESENEDDVVEFVKSECTSVLLLKSGGGREAEEL
jgi:hypothetical protein